MEVQRWLEGVSQAIGSIYSKSHTWKDDLSSDHASWHKYGVKGKCLDDYEDEGLCKARESEDERKAFGRMQVCKETKSAAILLDNFLSLSL